MNELKINDLRIGNLLNYEQTTHVVVGLLPERGSDGFIRTRWHRDPADLYQAPTSHHTGIPLSEEWLERMGFTNDSYSNFRKNIDEFLWLEISYEDYACTKLIEHPDLSDFGLKLKCKYVHQLQNLYFSISGEELTIKRK